MTRKGRRQGIIEEPSSPPSSTISPQTLTPRATKMTKLGTAERNKYLNVIDRLRELGVASDISLPQLVVVGDQVRMHLCSDVLQVICLQQCF